jgi:RNA polymerase sigma-70 factor (ECF subfamily)
MDAPDGELVRAARNGRREAFEELVRRYAAKLCAVCGSRLGRRGPVDDMVQEAFLRGYRSLGTLADPDKFGSWLYGIATRACLDWLKAKERSQVSFEALGDRKGRGDFPGERPALLPQENDRHQKLLDEVQSLPEIYREVVMLFYYRRQSYQEMGALLELTPAAINARLSKARSMLRERMARTVGP